MQPMVLLQIALHAIGDRANDEVAALYRSLPPVNRGNTMNSTSSAAVRRHRVEHAQHLSGPQALEFLREAGVVAVTNPLHLMSDVNIIEAKLGKGRAKPGLAFPSRALLQVWPHSSCQITSFKFKSCNLYIYIPCRRPVYYRLQASVSETLACRYIQASLIVITIS